MADWQWKACFVDDDDYITDDHPHQTTSNLATVTMACWGLAINNTANAEIGCSSW